MVNEISARVAELPRLSKTKLCALWQESFAKPAPSRIRRELMIPILAYRIQEKALGGLKKETSSRLCKLAQDLERHAACGYLANRIKPGTRLRRQWRGMTHEVTVIREGYLYRGKEYKSLSVIARQITGTRWSGPLFFGLKTKFPERKRN
jgi:hypothetical protein